MAVVDCENARVLISPQANNMRLFVVVLLANFYRTRERERERERGGGEENIANSQTLIGFSMSFSVSESRILF